MIPEINSSEATKLRKLFVIIQTSLWFIELSSTMGELGCLRIFTSANSVPFNYYENFAKKKTSHLYGSSFLRRAGLLWFTYIDGLGLGLVSGLGAGVVVSFGDGEAFGDFSFFGFGVDSGVGVGKAPFRVSPETEAAIIPEIIKILTARAAAILLNIFSLSLFFVRSRYPPLLPIQVRDRNAR
jgi:hypothetical protein